MNVGDIVVSITVFQYDEKSDSFSNVILSETLKEGRFITRWKHSGAIIDKEYTFNKNENGYLMIETVYLDNYEANTTPETDS